MKQFKSWLMLKYFLLACVYSFTNLQILQAQEVKVLNGQVSIEEGPVPGVNVFIKGSSIGTTTNNNGEYAIKVSTGDTILFSFIGYLSEELIYNNQGIHNVLMIPNIAELDQVIVIGYGTQKRSDITGAVASIDRERLEAVPKTHIGQILQGAIPGLSITQNASGADPANQTIMLRGQNSIKANNTPLIVIDGMPINGGQTGSDPLYALSDINQQDIESIEVLKDATSAAIYGARGSNGVILITTKKGSKGKAKVSYDMSFGTERLASKPDLMDAEEFLTFRLIRTNRSISSKEDIDYDNLDQYLSGVLTQTEIDNYNAGVNTDWVDVALRNGTKESHSLKISGGDDNTTYFVSGSYQKTKGIAKNDDFKKYSIRINLNEKVNSWLSAGTNTQFTAIDKSGSAAEFNQWGQRGAFFMNPLTKPYDSDGNLIIEPWPEQTYFRNPLLPLKYQQTDKNKRIITNNYVLIDFPYVEGLSYKLNSGFIYSNWQFNEYKGIDTQDGLAVNGHARIENSNTEDVLLEHILKYNRTFGNHSIDLTGLYSFQDITKEWRQEEGQGFVNDVLTTYQQASAGLLTANGSYKNQRYISYMGRLNYTYDSKYLFTFTTRRDGYSAFGSNNKFGIFPSVALGWNIHNEEFLNIVDAISNLKLRLSYGKNGNQAIDPYQTMARVGQVGFWNTEEMATYGYFASTLSNADLGWETSKTFNVGLDFGLLNDRISGTFEYYLTNTTDLLLDRAINSVHGIQDPVVTMNMGETQNTGIELGLSAGIISNPDFKWNLDVNFSHNKNKIVDLYGNGEDDVLNGWFVGEPINVNYGYRFDGIYQENDDLDNRPEGRVFPGYVKVFDVNNDTAITDIDRIILSNRDPKFIAGITNTFSYKGLSLNIFLHVVQGVTKANPYLETGRTWGDAQRNTINIDYWTPENPTNSYHINDARANKYNVLFYEDASFVRIKDVTLSYTIPKKWINKINVSNARIFVSGHNIYTFTKWSGLDPELDGQSSIPLTKSFVAGLNFTF